MIKEVPGGPGDTWSGEKTKSKNDIVNEYKDKINDKIRHLKSIKDRMVLIMTNTGTHAELFKK